MTPPGSEIRKNDPAVAGGADSCPSLDPFERQGESPPTGVAIEACHLERYRALREIDDCLLALGHLPHGAKIFDPAQLDRLRTQANTKVEGPVHPLVGARIFLPGPNSLLKDRGRIAIRGTGFVVRLTDGRYELSSRTGRPMGHNVSFEDHRLPPSRVNASFIPEEERDDRLIFLEQGLCTLVEDAGGGHKKDPCTEVTGGDLVGKKVGRAGAKAGKLAIGAYTAHWSAEIFLGKKYERALRWADRFVARNLGFDPDEVEAHRAARTSQIARGLGGNDRYQQRVSAKGEVRGAKEELREAKGKLRQAKAVLKRAESAEARAAVQAAKSDVEEAKAGLKLAKAAVGAPTRARAGEIAGRLWGRLPFRGEIAGLAARAEAGGRIFFGGINSWVGGTVTNFEMGGRYAIAGVSGAVGPLLRGAIPAYLIDEAADNLFPNLLPEGSGVRRGLFWSALTAPLVDKVVLKGAAGRGLSSAGTAVATQAAKRLPAALVSRMGPVARRIPGVLVAKLIFDGTNWLVVDKGMVHWLGVGTEYDLDIYRRVYEEHTANHCPFYCKMIRVPFHWIGGSIYEYAVTMDNRDIERRLRADDQRRREGDMDNSIRLTRSVQEGFSVSTSDTDRDPDPDPDPDLSSLRQPVVLSEGESQRAQRLLQDLGERAIAFGKEYVQSHQGREGSQQEMMSFIAQRLADYQTSSYGLDLESNLEVINRYQLFLLQRYLAELRRIDLPMNRWTRDLIAPDGTWNGTHPDQLVRKLKPDSPYLDE